METAVDKLEAMFQKAEADIEYVEKRLKFDFATGSRENGSGEGNAVQLLESLAAMKARHVALCAEVQEIAAEQKRSMDSIRAHLDATVQLVEELQGTVDVQVPPLTDEEREAREGLRPAVGGLSVQTQPEAGGQEAALAQGRCVTVSVEDFESVPRSIRENVKLTELNDLYRRLTEHRAPPSLHKMRNVRASEAAIRTLQHLSLVVLDKKGDISLSARH